jgi:hypothetical protein
VLSHLTPKKVHPVRGSLVLIAYLIPPKNISTSQGEHVTFDIDVKGGEKILGSFVAINAKGGEKSLGSFVAINAKGGDC